MEFHQFYEWISHDIAVSLYDRDEDFVDMEKNQGNVQKKT